MLGVPADRLIFWIMLAVCVCGALIAVGLLAAIINVAHLESEQEERGGERP